MRTVNIATNKDREDFAAFAVTSEGDVTWYAEAEKEAAAGWITIVAKVLDDPMFPAPEADWLESVRRRYEAVKRIGRPPLPDAERKTATLPPIRCSPDQRAKFERLGGAEWLRRAIDRAKA